MSFLSSAEQAAFYDTLKALRRNKRIHRRDARRFAYQASKSARRAASMKTKEIE